MLRKAATQLLGDLAGAVDRATTLTVSAGSSRSPRAELAHGARVELLERVLGDLPAPHLDFFEAPPRPQATLCEVSGTPQVCDLSWPSGYEPYFAGYRDRYLATPHNHRAHARLFRRRRPRPVAVIVHGYMSGHFALEPLLWPLAELDAQGFDAALFVLPFHGVRADPTRGLVPEFPGTHPRMAVEGLRQAVWDLRALLQWLREQGHPYCGLFGMSLGGYIAALTATIEPELGFFVPVVPLASLPDFSLERGLLSAPLEHGRLEHALLERIHRVVSPFSFTPRIAPDRVLGIGARSDRVTPIEHARRLCRHFRAPLIELDGGHLLQLGRRAAFGRVLELMRLRRVG